MSAQSDTPRTDALWEVKYNPDGSDLAWTVPKGKAALMLSRELERQLSAPGAGQELMERWQRVAQVLSAVFDANHPCMIDFAHIGFALRSPQAAPQGDAMTQLLQMGASVRRDHYYDEYVVTLEGYPVQRSANLQDILNYLSKAIRDNPKAAPSAPAAQTVKAFGLTTAEGRLLPFAVPKRMDEKDMREGAHCVPVLIVEDKR